MLDEHVSNQKKPLYNESIYVPVLIDKPSTEKYKEMVHYGKYCNENYFNFEFLTDYIIQKIEKL